jgi:hypothetical protein
VSSIEPREFNRLVLYSIPRQGDQRE